MTDDLCEIVIAAPEHDWLANLCRELVNSRLASSAHVVHPVTSIYRWDGLVHEAVEARAFLRSRVLVLETIVDFVTERHPYEVPNITAFRIAGGNPSYLEWIRDETILGSP